MGARKGSGKTKAERVAEEIAQAVGAGRAVAIETVDFSDPNRPKTCLEVDFPILPVNEVAIIEGNAGKPIYQMSKWWARRRSSVFRSLLLSAAMKAPDDPALAAKAVWDVYYGNHQKKGRLKHLKVADIFMGGGTTIVEGSRLGMQMWGTDLNPVAWFIVKNEMADVSRDEVERLLADVEAEIKPQVQPFYACACPRGHRGRWRRVSTGEDMEASFDVFALTPDERKDFKYEGPEIVYVFWAKHGPCQVSSCGHRTPIMSSPVMAVKTLTTVAWACQCKACGATFDLERFEARMAPGVPLVVAEGETPFASMDRLGRYACPTCGAEGREEAARVKGRSLSLGKPFKKTVELSLLVHPQWLAGEKASDAHGRPMGGSVTDPAEDTARWNAARSATMRLVEVRGVLPDEARCPDTGVTFSTNVGTVPRRSSFACGACGSTQDILTAVRESGRTAPVAAYAIQGRCHECDTAGEAYGGRFFVPVIDERPISAATREWAERRECDLADWWPRSALPYGFMTHMANSDLSANYGYTHWWTMFNPRQLLLHTQLLRYITRGGAHRSEVREFVLGAFQQYLRNQNMFSFWHRSHDKLAPSLSNANFHPKNTVIEVGAFSPVGYGPWLPTAAALLETVDWRERAWERVAVARLSEMDADMASGLKGESTTTEVNDPILPEATVIACGTATDLADLGTGSRDIVVTDPPFGGLLHYSELSDFFYVWLRLALKDHYPDAFEAEYTPKTLEAVSNRAREPEDPDGYYQRLLTQAWREAHRVLKPGGILAFTFHHSEDAPWVAVLESLFDAGFYLEATYPIRSDETKGATGQFGSKKIEYDIIHVCRKRLDESTPTSWARMRRAVLGEVRGLKSLLEHHQKEGLPEADLQIIRRGKALEFYSRHYGKVFVDEGRTMSVAEALVGINQLLDEEAGLILEPLPPNAEPMTRQFLRMFASTTELPRDQVGKFLRGTGLAPSDFEERGWCREQTKKTFQVRPPLSIALDGRCQDSCRLRHGSQAAAMRASPCVAASVGVT